MRHRKRSDTFAHKCALLPFELAAGGEVGVEIVDGELRSAESSGAAGVGEPKLHEVSHKTGRRARDAGCSLWVIEVFTLCYRPARGSNPDASFVGIRVVQIGAE
jgi:hypothetical protein